MRNYSDPEERAVIARNAKICREYIWRRKEISKIKVKYLKNPHEHCILHIEGGF